MKAAPPIRSLFLAPGKFFCRSVKSRIDPMPRPNQFRGPQQMKYVHDPSLESVREEVVGVGLFHAIGSENRSDHDSNDSVCSAIYVNAHALMLFQSVRHQKVS